MNGIVFILREPDLDEEPFYRDPHGTTGRFVGHREADDGTFAEASPVEYWTDVEEAIAWARTRAPVVVVRLGDTVDTIYSAGEVAAPNSRSWPPE